MTEITLKKLLTSKMFALTALLVLLTIVVNIGSNGAFFTVINIRIILDSMIITGLLTIGSAMLLVGGALDLSLGAVGTMAGIMFAFLVRDFSLSWPLALMGALIASAAFGALNAVLVNFVRFPAFIATLATMSIAEAAGMMITQGRQVQVADEFMRTVASSRVFNNVVPITVIILAVAFVTYGIILAKTRFGRQVYLSGSNPHATRLVGISPTKVSFVLFINGAALAAIAGIMRAARVGSATTIGITDHQFSGMIAAILGGVSFGGGSGGMLGAFMGLLIFSAFANGMFLLRISSFWNQVLFGMLLLISLSFDYIRSKRASKRKKAVIDA